MTEGRIIFFLAAKEIFISIYSIFNKNANILRASAIALAPSHLHSQHSCIIFSPRFSVFKKKIRQKVFSGATVGCLKGASLYTVHFSAFPKGATMGGVFPGQLGVTRESLFANGGRIIVISLAALRELKL